MDSFLDTFLQWEEHFQGNVFQNIIHVALNGRESWKDDEEVMEGLLAQMINCSVQISTNLSALELYAYSRLIEFKSFAAGGKNLLEVGAGTGELIATALEMKFDVEAIEISRRLANRLQNLFHMDIHCTDFLKFETDKKYDIVTMGDVIEHVTKPREALEKAHSLLKDSGVLWIATPYFESGFSRMLQDNDPMWREPYHISYFSYDIFKKMLEETGFEVVDYAVSQRYNGSMELFAKKVDKR